VQLRCHSVTMVINISAYIPEILKDISRYVDDHCYWVASELHNTV